MRKADIALIEHLLHLARATKASDPAFVPGMVDKMLAMLESAVPPVVSLYSAPGGAIVKGACGVLRSILKMDRKLDTLLDTPWLHALALLSRADSLPMSREASELYKDGYKRLLEAGTMKRFRNLARLHLLLGTSWLGWATETPHEADSHFDAFFGFVLRAQEVLRDEWRTNEERLRVHSRGMKRQMAEPVGVFEGTGLATSDEYLRDAVIKYRFESRVSYRQDLGEYWRDIASLASRVMLLVARPNLLKNAPAGRMQIESSSPGVSEA